MNPTMIAVHQHTCETTRQNTRCSRWPAARKTTPDEWRRCAVESDGPSADRDVTHRVPRRDLPQAAVPARKVRNPRITHVANDRRAGFG